MCSENSLDPELVKQLHDDVWKTDSGLKNWSDEPFKVENVLQRVFRNQLVIMKVLAAQNGFPYRGQA